MPALSCYPGSNPLILLKEGHNIVVQFWGVNHLGQSQKLLIVGLDDRDYGSEADLLDSSLLLPELTEQLGEELFDMFHHVGVMGLYIGGDEADDFLADGFGGPGILFEGGLEVVGEAVVSGEEGIIEDCYHFGVVLAHKLGEFLLNDGLLGQEKIAESFCKHLDLVSHDILIINDYERTADNIIFQNPSFLIKYDQLILAHLRGNQNRPC